MALLLRTTGVRSRADNLPAMSGIAQLFREEGDEDVRRTRVGPGRQDGVKKRQTALAPERMACLRALRAKFLWLQRAVDGARLPR
jgi:hypothetical protein